MGKQVVLVALNGESMCFVHVLLNGLDMKERGYEVKVVIEGSATKLVKERLRNSDALILEFNHDPDMLRQCERPWELKQRILSKNGHMSNEAALELLCELAHDRLQAVVMAHMSREANSPRLACSLVSERLQEIGRSNIEIVLGLQDEVGTRIEV